MLYSLKAAFEDINIYPSEKVRQEINVEELLKSMRVNIGIQRFDKAEEIREKILDICEVFSLEVPQECKVIGK